MSELTPGNTTVGDLCSAALEEAGRLGLGQTATADDITKAWSRLQWMLQQWERKRWLVYHLVTYSKVSTGQQSYTFGPGGEINTNQVSCWGLETLAVLVGGAGYAVNDTIQLFATPPAGGQSPAATVKVTGINGGAVTAVSVTIPGSYAGPLPTSFTAGTTSGAGAGATFNNPIWGLLTTTQTGASASARPPKLEAAFLRQIANATPNQPDVPLRILQSMEDYTRIGLKGLLGYPGCVFLDSQWPLANLFCYPVASANIYSINLTVMEQLPTSFPTLATPLNLPYEYYAAILYNLAYRLLVTYNIPSFPGDPLPGLAKESLNVLRGPNTQIAELGMPGALAGRGARYNIFSDQSR